MNNNTRPAGVLGASGYVGRELLSLVERHGALEVAFATSESEPQVAGVSTVPLEDSRRWWAGSEIVFSCLPHGVSAPVVREIRSTGARVIDLSADFRLDDAVLYGLTETVRPDLGTAELVANPGCYPTGALLGLLPLVRAGLVDTDRPVVINSASGVSGAGRSPKRELLFAEVAEDFRAYGVGNQHRHLPEIQRRLEPHAPGLDVIFTPHLLPIRRGILTTIQVPVSQALDQEAADRVFREAYDGEACVAFGSSSMPSLRDVVYRNRLALGVVPTHHVTRPTLTVVTAIDNLLKGAAGQAIQNMNVMLGFQETRGLPC
jgi:N-acetyl-gamma-glutamyl-phosphate reductase